jgi:NDP-sugar pyrophosphorylase family protein
MNNQVVILAGGLATRMGELTKNKPKSLLEADNKPFLTYQLEMLIENGISDVVLCIGHLGTQIRDTFGDGSKYGVNLRYSIEENPLGTAGALKNAEPLLADKFFVMYGDSYLFLDFQKAMTFFNTKNKQGLVAVYKNNNLYDKSNIVIKGDLVTKYSKTETAPDMIYIDYGANIFKKEVLKLIPAGGPYPLENVVTRLIEKQELLAFEVKDRFYEIGSPQGLRDFEDYARKALKK